MWERSPSDPPVRIRHLDYPNDSPQVLSFLPDLYETNFPGFKVDTEFVVRKRNQLREAARDPGQAVLVAEDSNGICGFIWLVIEVDYSGRRRGEVNAIYTARRVRGQGVGRKLMEEGENLLRTYGCESVMLMVTASNEPATNLYQSMGYEVTRHQMEKMIRRGPR
ncbi:MAG: GNAT family N-acetyltransferase [Bacillota bacterium]